MYFKILNLINKSLFLFILSLFISGSFFSQLRINLATNRFVDIENINIAPQDFDLVIITDSLKKITSKSTKKHKSEQLALDEAYFNAIINNEIDVLVNPIYSMNKTKKVLFLFGGNYEAQISGYAGYYKQLNSKSNINQSDNCQDDTFDCFIKKLEQFSKKYKQEVTEEKEVKIVDACDNCKNGKEPLKLLIITTKKTSIIDSYLKASH